MLAASVTHQNSSISKFLEHAILAPRTRSWSHHFPSQINFMGHTARLISFFDVLNRNWHHLSKIHRAKRKLWTETRHVMSRMFCSTKTSRNRTLTSRLLARFLYITNRIVFTSRIPSIRGMRPLSEQPPARSNKFRQVPAASVTHTNSSFSKFLEHAIFVPRTRPWSHHFPFQINFLGHTARLISFFVVLTWNWHNLSKIHRTKLKLCTETRHHVVDFLLIKILRKRALAKRLLVRFLYTKKRIAPRSHIPSIRGMRALSEQPPAGPNNFRQVPAASATHQNYSVSTFFGTCDFGTTNPTLIPPLSVSN